MTTTKTKEDLITEAESFCDRNKSDSYRVRLVRELIAALEDEQATAGEVADMEGNWE